MAKMGDIKDLSHPTNGSQLMITKKYRKAIIKHRNSEQCRWLMRSEEEAL